MSGRPLVLVGAGALGLDALSVYSALEAQGSPPKILGYLDDDPGTHGRSVGGHPVLGGLDWLRRGGEPVDALVTVGEPGARERVRRQLEELGVELATWIHPGCTRTESVTFGSGCLIMGNTSFTIDVTIGKNVVVNPGTTVAHEVSIGDDVYVCPGVDITGRVRIGKAAFIGTGAVILPGCDVAEGAVVGAGAVVTTDVAPGETVAGIPATPLSRGEGTGR